MSASRWPEADAILDQALLLPPGERIAFVRSVAGGDQELAQHLERVVAESVDESGFLQPVAAMSGSIGDDVRQALDLSSSPHPALAAGARIEHYEVLALIGRGGMGEVYRAYDSRLHRNVALKVLPESFARSAERIARFRREARVLAMLSHPGIAAIYGIAESDGIEALVLELVEGPTLADRLSIGALSQSDAIPVARHLADAIAAAHAGGILHRDLKPANIKVLPDGSVKVLDFGLAKALQPASGDSTNLTAAAQTVLLGTAPYVSPEQIRGATVDERADIWAFGCILFEMLTGVRAFGGGSSHEVLAKIVEREPAFSLLPSATAPALRRLLRRCLDKSPQRRLGFIGDARLDLDDAITDATIEAAPSRWTPRRIAAAMLVTMALGATLGALLGRRAPTDRVDEVSRFAIPLGRGEAAVTGFQSMLALSPDGRVLVYRASREGVTRLYRRALHELEAQPIPGTENATGPFFSPDGRWLGFDSDGVLKRVSLSGGLPVVIAAAPGGVTSTWLSDDTIVFGSNTRRVLQRVSASGGEPEAITTLDLVRGDTLHVLPEALPGHRAVLFTIVAGNNRHVANLDLDSRRIAILTDGSHARFMAPQHMLFARDGVLWGAVLDAGNSRLAGPPAPLVEGIEHTDNTVLHLAAGGDGSIVYLPAGQNVQGSQRFVWRDRQGRETPIGLEPRPYTRIALSPDNTRLAFTLSERGNTDIWVANLERGSMSRLTVDATIETMPTWSPDGRFVAFRSEREGPGLFRRDAQGAGEIERLTRTDGPIHSPYSWTPDGKTLLFAIFRSFGRQAIASVTPPDHAVRVLLDGEFAQLDPQVSPDGRWLSYQSDETGRFEVYVRPYPEVTAARWQVSDAGGRTPRWSPDGRELFYYDGAALMSVPVSPAKEFTYGSSKRLFPIDLFGGRLGPDYEVSSDGRRFLFIVTRPSPDAAPAHLVFVQHLDEDLRARLGR